MSEKKIERMMVVVNDAQANVIMEALELYARLGTGQMNAIDSVKFMMENGPGIAETEPKLNELKSLYFPGMHPNQSHGIRSEKTPEESKVAWDMLQVMRNKVAWHKQPEGGTSVNFQNPYQVSENEPLIKCTIVE